ncbi:MAG: ribbon-helix-helix protein, CopG family [Alphaproteobacteria bacterium]|nr:ribbon-helix-helix protein, CopG family [Alphaproteobacteria bacterium]
MANLSVRIPDQLDFALEVVAKKQERNKSFFIRKALESYLEDFHDYQTAKTEYAKYLTGGKKTVALKDLAKDLGIKLHHYRK